MPNLTLLRLSSLAPGNVGKVAKVEGKGSRIRRLLEMGLVRGTTLKVLRKAPLGDPIEVELRGYLLSLRREEAEHILVEVG